MKPVTVAAKPAPVFRTFNNFGGEDNPFRDKYGFQNDDVSLSDAFALEAVKFKDNSLFENQFQQVSMQNKRLWIFT